MQRWTISVLLGAMLVLWVTAVWLGLERRRQILPRQSTALSEVGMTNAKAPRG